MNVEDEGSPPSVVSAGKKAKAGSFVDRLKSLVGLGQDEEQIQRIRVLRTNDNEYNATQNFPSNYISTTKYNALTFIFVNVFEQFQRLANTYFLVILILELIPFIAALHWWITFMPLLFVLSVTAIKDAIDDFQRWSSDKEINNRMTRKFENNDLVDVEWHKVKVGDLIYLSNDEAVPADILLVSSSAPNGLAYIETAELDGETNLKVKQSLAETENFHNDKEMLSSFLARVECEPPNNRLDKFVGKLIVESMEQTDREEESALSLDNEKIILRGCVIRNTKWVVGMVIFTGHQSKLMMNSGKPKLKRTHIDKLLNNIVYYILGLLMGLCVLCGVGAFIWETIRGDEFQIYAPWEAFMTQPIIIALMRIPSYIIVLNTLVPISLYVSVELIRLGQSQFINWDLKMYHRETDTPARARSTALNEELGQIRYVFSDKTGTLTQNMMVFHKASIDSVAYGDHTMSESDIPEVPLEKIDFAENNPYAEERFVFYDRTIMKAIDDKNQEVHKFFQVLALCHTVLSELDNGELLYQAQSPDEEALLSAARNFGFVFLTRDQRSITILNQGVEEKYEMLALLDFDNVRKRMSVILRGPDNKVRLLCKGADSTVIPLLKESEHQGSKLEHTLFHMNNFAKDGLRTLIIAVKEIPDVVFHDWNVRFEAAKLVMEDREEAIAVVYDEIEMDLDLVGSSAIEDKLQDGVPDTIAKLARASIKIWVLTGDKQETAINIGYSCRLIRPNMEVIIVEGDDYDETRLDIKEHLGHIQDRKKAARKEAVEPEFALVVTGGTLLFALEDGLKADFLTLAKQCNAVVCCRVTPLQKAMVVRLVKDDDPENCITLAIGDGANDVSMIREAHIGVGISGKEGKQAVLASDFCFAQFRFLERLLLVHGHWSYIRMCKFLRYFFFKNFAFTLVQLFYAPFCGFTAQTIFDPLYITLYNVVFTSIPVMIIGVLDQELSIDETPPEVYEVGQLDQMFNKQAFALSGFHGFIVAAACMFIPWGVFHESINVNGLDQQSMYFIGTAIAGIVTVVVNLQVALETTLWTALNHVFTWGSILMWFIMFALLCSSTAFVMSPENFTYFDAIYRVLQARTWWLTLFLTSVVCIFPYMGYKLYIILTKPSLLQEVMYNIEKDKQSHSTLSTITRTFKAQKEKLQAGVTTGMPIHFSKNRQSKRDLWKGVTGRPSTAPDRHGYAFAGADRMGSRLAGGELFNKIHRTDTSINASRIVDVEGEPLPLIEVRPRSGSIRGSRSVKASQVVSIDRDV